MMTRIERRCIVSLLAAVRQSCYSLTHIGTMTWRSITCNNSKENVKQNTNIFVSVVESIMKCEQVCLGHKSSRINSQKSSPIEQSPQNVSFDFAVLQRSQILLRVQLYCAMRIVFKNNNVTTGVVGVVASVLRGAGADTRQGFSTSVGL